MENLIDLLRKISTNLVASSQHALSALPPSVQTLAQLASVLTLHPQDLIKLNAASVINRLIVQNYTQMNENALCQFLLTLIVTPSIPAKALFHLRQSTTYVLEFIQEELRDTFCQTCIQICQKITQDSSNKGKSTKQQIVRMYESVFMILQCFFSISHPQQTLFAPYEVMNIVQDAIHLTHPFSSNQATQYLHQGMLNLWSMLVEELNDSSSMLQEYIMDNQSLYDQIDIIYKHSASGNNLLSSALHIHSEIVESLQNVNDYDVTVFGCSLTEHIDFIIKVATHYATHIHQADITCTKENECKEIASYALIMLNALLQLHPETFTYNWEATLKYMVIPLLAADQEEIQMFQQSIEQFNAVAEDCCSDYGRREVKTETAKFVDKMIDFSKEVYQYVLCVCEKSIKCVVQAAKKKKQTKQTNIVNVGFANISLQTTFTLLTITGHFHEIVSASLCFVSQVLAMFNQLSPLQRGRAYILLSFLYQCIYPHFQQGQHIVIYALEKQTHPSAKYLALDFIQNLLTLQYSPVLFNILLQKCFVEHWNLFESMIVRHYRYLNSDSLNNVIQVLIKEINRSLETSIPQQHIFNCIHLINKITTIVPNTQLQPTQYIQSLAPVLSLYNKAPHLHIEEQIIKLLAAILQISPNLSPIQQLLPQILANFQGIQSHSAPYCNLLLLYLLKCTEFSAVQQITVRLLKVCLKFLSQMEVRFEKSADISIGNILLLFHTLLIRMKVPQDYEKGILNLSEILLDNYKRGIDHNPRVVARTLNTFLLCEKTPLSLKSLDTVLKTHSKADRRIFQYALVKMNQQQHNSLIIQSIQREIVVNQRCQEYDYFASSVLRLLKVQKLLFHSIIHLEKEDIAKYSPQEILCLKSFVNKKKDRTLKRIKGMKDQNVQIQEEQNKTTKRFQQHQENKRDVIKKKRKI